MLSLINKLSLFLFLVFFISFLLKLLILYKKNGIKANTLAKGGKSREIHDVEIFVNIATTTWGALWLLLSLTEPKVDHLIGLFTGLNLLRYIGTIVLAVGVSIFIIAMTSMKTSWRVGIDKKSETSLVTAGIYKYSRNPAFLGFDIMFAGFALTYPSLPAFVVAAINILAIHRLILQEEKHLESAFGDKYEEYKGKTPRYIVIR